MVVGHLHVHVPNECAITYRERGAALNRASLNSHNFSSVGPIQFREDRSLDDVFKIKSLFSACF